MTVRVVEFVKMTVRDLPQRDAYRHNPDFDWELMLIAEPLDPKGERHITQLEVARPEDVPEAVRKAATAFNLPPLQEAVLVVSCWAVARPTWAEIEEVAETHLHRLGEHPDRYEVLQVLHAWRSKKGKGHVAAWQAKIERRPTEAPLLGKWDVAAASGPTAEALKSLVAA